MPLKDFYQKEGKYLPVNGSGVVDEIFDNIAKGIEQATGEKRRTRK